MKNNRIETVKMILKSGVIVKKDRKEKHTTFENILKEYVYIHNSLTCLGDSEFILNNYIEQESKNLCDNCINKTKTEFNETEELYEQLNDILFDEFYDLELGLINLLSTFILYGNEDIKNLILPYNRKFLPKLKEISIYDVIRFALQDFLDSCSIGDTKNHKKLLQHFMGIFAIINMQLDEIRENAHK